MLPDFDRSIPEEELASFGAWVARRRRYLDLTQEDLARRVGCSVIAIRKIEYDQRRPSLQLAELIARHLNIPEELGPSFVKVARGLLPVERLKTPQPIPAIFSKSSDPPDTAIAPTGTLESEQVVTFTPHLHGTPSPLVGRQSELAAITRLLDEPQCRLLTLIGPGGIGKTRLSIEYAAQSTSRYTNGVIFVPLAPVQSPEGIIPAMGGALGLEFHGAISERSQLVGSLVKKHLLIILDNVEHLLDGVDLFGEILERSPQVKILATSRQRLELSSEWTMDVHGLPVPASDQAASMQNSSAISLFLQHARRAFLDFPTDPQSLAGIARICRLVGGMPLGIELAASWVNVLSTEEIASEIERSLDILTSSQRDIPARHRSMRAVFEQSWQRLSDDERCALRRMAVFRGGFSRTSAQRVARANLVTLATLNTKSLLVRDETGRYSLHELVRQFALDQAGAAKSDESETRRLHAEYYAEILQHWNHKYGLPEQVQAQTEALAEIDNLRLAWDWMLENRATALIKQALQGLLDFYSQQGWNEVGIDAFSRAEERLHQAEDPHILQLLAELKFAHGAMRARAGQSEAALRLLHDSLETLDGFGPSPSLCSVLRALADEYLSRGEYESARQYALESLGTARLINDSIAAATCLNLLGYIHQSLGKYQHAYDFFDESVQISRHAGYLRLVALSLSGKSLMARESGRLDEARGCAQEGLEISMALHDEYGVADTLNSLGMVAMSTKDYPRAQEMFRQAAQHFEQINYPFTRSIALGNLGMALLADGYVEEADLALRISIDVATEAQAIPIVLGTLVTLAEVRQGQGQPQQALAILYFALDHPATNREARQRAEVQIARLEPSQSGEQIVAARNRAAQFRLDDLHNRID